MGSNPHSKGVDFSWFQMFFFDKMNLIMRKVAGIVDIIMTIMVIMVIIYINFICAEFFNWKLNVIIFYTM